MNAETTVTNITTDDITNILSCADSGCAYWCFNWDYDQDDYQKARETAKKIGKACFEDILAEMLISGGKITFECSEDDDYTKDLTLENLTQGIARAIDNENCPKNMDDIDAADADNIIQEALFGEVVFG